MQTLRFGKKLFHIWQPWRRRRTPIFGNGFSESKCLHFWGVPTLEETFFAGPTFRKNLSGVSSTAFVPQTPRWGPGAVSETMLRFFLKVGPTKKVSSKVGTPPKRKHFDSENPFPKYGNHDLARDDAGDGATTISMAAAGASAAPSANTSASASHSSIHAVSRVVVATAGSFLG